MSLRDGLPTHSTVAQSYARRVSAGDIREDPAQKPIVAALDRLNDEIQARRLASKSSALGWLFAKKRDTRAIVKGLYIHGSVGRGKTMLMDLFFSALPVRRKRRVHFNAFMADVHDRIQKQRQARKDGTSKEDDPIPPVAKALAEEAYVLCFDEFSVTDIADAMVLSRLFSALFAEGVVLVATSNVAPDDLYRDGLNRELFTPFIGLLKHHATVMDLDSPTDYRMEKLNRMPVYLTPLSPETDKRMDEAWKALAGNRPVTPETILVKGRTVPVPRAAGDAARFSFSDLCERPLAARDYLAITARYSTIMLDHVPVLAAANRNEAKRFILLIDTVYDRHVRLLVSAAASPDALYADTRGTEGFEFARTVSRLTEMQGQDWLDQWRERHTSPSERETLQTAL